MQLLRTILIGFILLSLGLPNVAMAFDRALLFDAFNSIVMVRGYNPDGSMAYGSGVVITKTTVLTNCHIFRNTKQPWVSRGEESYAITGVQADRYHDLCLLTTDPLPLTPAKIGSSTNLRKGQELVAIGHSSGSPAPINSVGTVKSAYPYESNGYVVRTNARFAMGASGSGLYDGEGHLIGINTFKTPGRAAYFYALPVEWLDDLQKLTVETQFPINGKAFWEEDDDKKPYFMQMALPELNKDWTKLAAVATQWTKDEPNNTEAWYELGHAEENMGHLKEAESLYDKALAISAGNSDALFRLGVIANNRGDQAKVKEINMTLSQLDADIAQEFTDAVSCKADSNTNCAAK